jgi:hypothetical protein
MSDGRTLKEGRVVRVHDSGSVHDGKLGMVYKLGDVGIHDVFFDDNGGDIVPIDERYLYLPLHEGVFLDDESIERWQAEFASSKLKLLTALASGAFDRVEDVSGIDIPDEIVNTIKKIIAVLGSPEAISLFRLLIGK